MSNLIPNGSSITPIEEKESVTFTVCLLKDRIVMLNGPVEDPVQT